MFCLSLGFFEYGEKNHFRSTTYCKMGIKKGNFRSLFSLCSASLPGWRYYVQCCRWSMRRNRAERDVKIQGRMLWRNRKASIKTTSLWTESPMSNNFLVYLTGAGDVIMSWAGKGLTFLLLYWEGIPCENSGKNESVGRKEQAKPWNVENIFLLKFKNTP